MHATIPMSNAHDTTNIIRPLRSLRPYGVGSSAGSSVIAVSKLRRHGLPSPRTQTAATRWNRHSRMSKDAPAQYSLALSTDKGIAQTNTAARESQLRRNGEQTAGARRSEVSFPLMTVDEVLSPRRPADPGTDEVLDATEAPRFESRAPAVAMRMPLVLFAAAGVLFASGAPSVTIGVHLLNEPLSFETWAFSYPMTAVGLIGVVLFWSSLGRRPVRSWPWAIWPLALLVGWSLLSVVWSVSPELTGPRALTSVGIAAFSVWFGYELKFDEQLVALALFPRRRPLRVTP